MFVAEHTCLVAQQKERFCNDVARVVLVYFSESVEESEENADVTVIEKKLKDGMLCWRMIPNL